MKNRSRIAFVLTCVALAIGLAWWSGSHAKAQVAAVPRPRPSEKSASVDDGSASAAAGDWSVYGGSPAGNHYSSLKQIDRENVGKLRVAWSFDTEETGGLETNPLIIDGILYAFTPTRKVIALDGASGKLLWKFDSGIPGAGPSRGLAYWTDGHEPRILAGISNFLYALDPGDGKPIPSFGESGRIDLRKGLGRDYRKQSIRVTSPGIVYHDLIIIGGAEPEDKPAPPGDIRAYDVRTGAQRWIFHTIPHPGEFGYDTWPKDAWKTAGSANNWAGMSVDVQRGIVYVPTGSAVPDFYGGDRTGNDLFADCLLALDAETGRRIWYFQGVHHDIWDRDFPAPPVLLTVRHGGKQIDAVAQTTKSGFVYLFDRTNGKPLFPIKESSYPRSTVPGEVTSPTQPLPTVPLPFARQIFTENMVTNRTPEAHAWALQQFHRFVSAGQFIPESADKLTIILPGTGGGGEWGGAAVDPSTDVLYVNANEMPRLLGVTVPPPPGNEGQRLYQDRCSVCHGVNRAGSPPEIPSLLGITAKLSDPGIAQTIHQGKGRMPPFPDISDQQAASIIGYLKTVPAPGARPAAPESAAAGSAKTDEDRYANHDRYRTVGSLFFVDQDGYPAIVPPWGTLNAINLDTGKYLWKIPFGEYPELAAKGVQGTGSMNYGGPVVTASGLLFIAATVFDQEFYAYDAHTGKLLWESKLPYPGMATPATYLAKGKQYVVIAGGGGAFSREPKGGVYVAYSLP